MLFGHIHIDDNVVVARHTHYFLETVNNLSAPRVFLAPGLMIAVASAAFIWSFWDILWPVERLALLALSVFALLIGVSIRRLEFISRDLTRAQQTCVIYGTSGEVNRACFEIAAARRKLMREGGHDKA